MVDPVRAVAFHARYLLLAFRLGEDYDLARALTFEVGYSALFGVRRQERTRRVSALMRVAADRCKNPHAPALASLAEGMAGFLEGRWKVALERMSIAETFLTTQCRAAEWELATARLIGGVSLFFLGELRRLQERLPILLEAARARGDLYEASDLQIRVAHAASLAADRPSEAREQLREAIARWPRDAFYIPHWWAMMVEAEVACYEGQPLTALEVLRGGWGRLWRSGLLLVQYVRVESLYHRAHACVAAAKELRKDSAQRRVLLRRAARDARRIERAHTPWGTPLATLIQAGIATLEARDELAVLLASRAEVGLNAADMSLFAAAARCLAGNLRGGPTGRTLEEEAVRTARLQGVLDPQRMMRALAPV
jgi:hypothetical protein